LLSFANEVRHGNHGRLDERRSRRSIQELKIQGLVPEGQELQRQVLFDQLYSSIPKDPEARVQVYTAEIVPKGWTNFHCHNGAPFFLALQGIFEAHFEEGILIRAKAGDVCSEPIGRMHRGHNPHNTIPYLCIGFASQLQIGRM
jgi:quercetin dioxygenase-like cupin family protein